MTTFNINLNLPGESCPAPAECCMNGEDLYLLMERVMTAISELPAQLAAINAQVQKSKAEIITRVAALEAALLASGELSADAEAELEALKASVQSVDDLNPDAPPADPVDEMPIEEVPSEEPAPVVEEPVAEEPAPPEFDPATGEPVI